jgi:hypothetical protein
MFQQVTLDISTFYANHQIDISAGGGKNRGKCQISDECSNNERLWLDEMHNLKMAVKFCTKLSFTVFFSHF